MSVIKKKQTDEAPLRGRPPLEPEVARTKRVVTFVTDAELDALIELERATSQSRSAVVHDLITQSLSDLRRALLLHNNQEKI